jgi:hypothetical protein
MLHQHLPAGRIARATTLMLLAAVMTIMAAGCSDELDSSEPEGAYYIFRNALIAGDAETVWERTDGDTRAYFQKRYEHLVDMDETIERYLPQTDHKIARKQSGAVLLDEVKDGKGLFLKVFKPVKLDATEAIRIGSDLEELKVAEDDSAAKVVTRAGQEYVLTHDEHNEEWHVMLVRSTDKVEASFGWLTTNQSALQQTVEDLIAEERKKRETIIAELMDKKK